MNVIEGMRIEDVFCVYMEPGEDFHKCIERAAEERDIRAGAILSGIGTFDKARIHHIVDTDFPAKDKFVEIEGPVELCSVDGIIADCKPHMHCTMALRGGELFSGHLEPGCRVLYLAEVVIARFSGPDLERDKHPEFGTPRLKVRDTDPVSDRVVAESNEGPQDAAGDGASGDEQEASDDAGDGSESPAEEGGIPTGSDEDTTMIV